MSMVYRRSLNAGVRHGNILQLLFKPALQVRSNKQESVIRHPCVKVFPPFICIQRCRPLFIFVDIPAHFIRTAPADGKAILIRFVVDNCTARSVRAIGVESLLYLAEGILSGKYSYADFYDSFRNKEMVFAP